MNKLPYKGVVFNADWAATKSEKEFIEHEKHHGLSDTELKEAYKLCKEAVKPSEAKPVPTT